MNIAIVQWYYMDQNVKSSVINTELLPLEWQKIFEEAVKCNDRVDMHANDMSYLLKKAEVKEFPVMVAGHVLVAEDPS